MEESHNPFADMPSYEDARYVNGGDETLTEEAIAAREAELDREEAVLNEHESTIRSPPIFNAANTGTGRPRNFPPLINLWEFYPEQDLTAETLPLMNLVKQVFLLCYIVYGANFAGGVILLPFGRGIAGGPGSLIVWSILYLVTLLPVVTNVCFFVLYEALKLSSGMKFLCFLGTYAVFGLIVLKHAIGGDSSGTIGVITMINMFGATILGGLVALVVCVGYVALLGGIAMSWIKCAQFYTGKGLSARSEVENAARGVVRDHQQDLSNLIMNNLGAVIPNTTFG